jgi:predicted kinase
MNFPQLQFATHADLVAWAETQPWCQAMAACAQDAQWHAEGDVWTHTQRVLDEVTRLDAWKDLSLEEQTILRWTALLHDAAKPLTTEVDATTGRVSSPRHAIKGEQLARGILRELGCELGLREQIARMVRFHGRPVFLLERDDPAHEVIRLSWLVNNRLLYQFALADNRGRDTDSLSRPEENLHFWKLAAEEAGCFEDRYHFPNDAARFQFYRSDSPDLHYVPYEDYACTVTMMSGLPGSGKDHWLRDHRAGLPVVTLDDVRDDLGVDPTDDQGRVVQLARERCREHLRAGVSFAFNATNTLRETRRRWIDLFADYRARIEIVYIEPPLSQILHQNRTRERTVPERVIRRLAQRLEPPNWTECHGLVLGDLGKART